MALDIVFKIGEATATAFTIIGFCLIIIFKDITDAFIFLICAFGFIAVLRLIEQGIFDYNCRNNYDHMPQYH